MNRLLLSAALGALSCASAFGQAFNVDVGTSVSGGGGSGAPSAGYGGAANQPGVWNDLIGAATGPMGLLDLGGVMSGVTLSRNTGEGGDFGFDNANTTGDVQALLDDGHDLSAASANPAVYTFAGLANGPYSVYVYAFAPDFPPDLTNVSVNGSPTQTIGGTQIAGNALVLGNTHGLFDVNVTDGTLTITADGATVNDFGTLNAIQLVPEPATLALLALGGLATRARRRA